MPRVKVFVTGALGFIGRALSDRWRQAGAQVSGVDRVADPARGVVAGDVLDPSAWAAQAAGADIVVHTAALVSNEIPHRRLWEINVLGTRRVVEVAAAAGAGRFVHLSSIAAFGFELDGDVPETHPVQPNRNPYVDTKIASEQVVLQAHAAGELVCTVVRPADVYGPGSRPWTVLPVRMLQRRQFLLPAWGRGCFSPVYVDNLVDGVVLAAERPEGAGQVFTISDGTTIPAKEFFGHYGRMTGRRVVGLPTGPAAVLAGAQGTLLRAAGRESEAGVQTVRMLARSGGYSIEKARTMLGYAPAVALDEGMARSEAWLRAQGLL